MNARWACVSVVLIGAALAPAPARAMGAVVGKEGESVRVVAARLALATTEGRTARWGQVSVEGASAGFVWLVPVAAGARLDLASDAWLDALDAATSEVVLPPSAPAPCSEVALDPEYVAPTTAAGARAPSEVLVLSDLASLDGFVTGAGFAIPDALATPLGAAFAAGGLVAALRYDESDLPTHAIRIVDGALPSLPLAWTAVAAKEAHVTAFVIGAGPAVAGSSLALDPSSVLWGWSGSNYEDATRSLLLSHDGWLRQAAMAGLLFRGAPAAPGAALPSIVTPYYLLAQAYDATVPGATCAAAAGTTSLDTNPYPSPCPPGSLAVAPGSSVCAADAGDGGAADPLACPGADDAALAFSGLPAEGAWVTRLERLVTPARGTDDAVRISGLTPLGPTLTASGYSVACSNTTGPINAGPPTSGSSTPPPDTSDGNDNTAAAEAAGCGIAMDACSSSSESDSGDSGGCGGSGSSEGSDSGGGCGSSGSSEGSDSGGGCGGSDSSSSGSSSCTTTRRARGPRSSPVSRVVMLGVALAAIARRRTRPAPARSTRPPCPPGTRA